MKQLQSDPWDAVEKAYAIGTVHKGRVTNITDYGAFVELEAGVEGLVHVSEMSWTKKNVHPGKIVSTSQEVEVMVLEIDSAKRRVSLGLKQTQRNPWEVFVEKFPVGSTIEGEVKNITEFGLFVGLEGDIDGMVHLSDLSWDQRGEDAIQSYRKGDVVKAAVTEVDVEKERISLSIKALGDDTFTDAVDGVKRGTIITVAVSAVEDGGIEVEYNGQKSFIRRSDLSRDRGDQRPERFQVGDKVDVRVTNIDPKTRKLGLSIKAREIAEEKEAVEQYGSSDSGASLGDILGAALKDRADRVPTAKIRKAPPPCGAFRFAAFPQVPVFVCQRANPAVIVGQEKHRGGGCPTRRTGRPTTGGTRMIRSELIQKIADENPHLTQRHVERIVNTVFEEIIEALAKGDRVELRGFGAFSVKSRDATAGAQPPDGRGSEGRRQEGALLQDRQAVARPAERQVTSCHRACACGKSGGYRP